MNEGDVVPDVCGPLGTPTDVEPCTHAVAIGGGVGIALIWPIAAALAQHCDRVTGIISARTEEFLILRDEMSDICADLLLATDDGSAGHKGFPTELLVRLLEGERQVDAVYAVGPVPMMAAVSEVTRPYGVRTIVSLNPIMVDGTGMCGGCRVTVNGEMKFACCDGPEFDAHGVDFDELMDRLTTYRTQERAAWDRHHQHDDCPLPGDP
jgi:ferredoxin--NADP+ reductase